MKKFYIFISENVTHITQIHYAQGEKYQYFISCNIDDCGYRSNTNIKYANQYIWIEVQKKHI